MKKLRYLPATLKNLKRHDTMRARIVRTIDECAVGTGAHANQVKALRGAPGMPMRVGDFRVLFEETDDMITVAEIGPRGDIYE